MTDPYPELIERVREAALLESTAAILGWDQETMMPPGGIEHRARQLAQLARSSHRLRVDERIADLLEACAADARIADQPEGIPAANVRDIQRQHERARRLPPALVAEIAEVTSLAQHEWAAARQHSDFLRFRPWLHRVVQLMQAKADCLAAGSGGQAWDALADEYEPGITARALGALFPPLVRRLEALLEDLLHRGKRPDGAFVTARVPVVRQEELVRTVAAQIGFDFARGRLDRSAHPFCSASHCGDVRITTRFAEDRPLDSLGSVMHEAGHGLYEQGLLPEHCGTPLGEAASLGLHESQSRLWENQVGRSAPFWTWCHPQLLRAFGAGAAGLSRDDLYGAANLVQRDFIRVEADEVTYNLHVAIRFELELALIHGELAVADLPAAWNDSYRAHLGLEVPDDRRGCLQDVHWASGLFGYFPTYTLGNLYAAQLFARAQEELPGLDASFARGEFAPLRLWLNGNVHRHGKHWPAAQLCERVTGKPSSIEPLLAYLEGKLRPLYGV